MASPPCRLLLASLHDVSPRFEAEVDCLVDLLAPHVGQRIALLVVPNHWGDAPILAGSPFAARLRRWAECGMEIFLHGYFHGQDEHPLRLPDRIRAHLMTNAEGEFLAISRKEAQSRIRRGVALLEDLTGLAVAGFVAPAWLYGRDAREALAALRLPIAEDHFSVWSPATGRRLARGPVITWASRSAPRLACSLAAAAALRRLPMPVMRIGVHPPDCRHPALVRDIERTFAIAGQSRRAGRYRDLLG